MQDQPTRLNKLKIPLALVVLYAALPLFILTTDPSRLPLPLLTVPFILLFVVLFVTFLLLGRRLAVINGLSRRRQLGVVGMLAGIPMLLAVFQSLHQLSIRDILIGAALVIGLSIYVSKADFLR